MPDIKQLTENGTQFYPETGLSAVIDGNGNDLTTLLAGKQATLVSGTNIKTVNNQSLLGSGNINISGGGSSGVSDVTLGGTSVVSSGVAVLPAYPTVPTISTSISTDASSDTKTASPKAVKTYVDGKVPTISTNITTDASSDTKTASPKAVKTYVDNGFVPKSGGTMSDNAELVFSDGDYNQTTVGPASVVVEDTDNETSVTIDGTSPSVQVQDSSALATYRSTAIIYKPSNTTYSLSFPSKSGTLATTGDIPSAVTETTVSNWGFTKNAGTITGITMNGSSKGTSGVVDLGTVLTSYTETDPVFTASAAHGISSTDITNWNAKQKAITVSSSTPTSSDGSNGDIWIVI